jgi:hypothetical protein
VRPPAASLILSVCIAATLNLYGIAQAQARVSAEQYGDRLDLAIDLTELDDAAPSPARMELVRRALGLPVRVVVGEWSALIPPDPLLERLSGETTLDFQRAGAHLEAMRSALDTAVGRDVPSPESVQESLDRAYRSVIQIRPSLLERIRRAVGEFLAYLFYRLVNFAGPSSLLAWAVVVGLVAAALLLLRRARLVPERVLPGRGRARVVETGVDWRRRAQEALRAGDLPEAIRALYLVLISTLAGRGLLADAPALTAGECRAAVRRNRPSLYPLVARATESYERVVYGGVRPGKEDVDSLLEAEEGARSQ